MAETMMSREDAADLKRRIDRMVDELEAGGFERGMIGAAMVGIGSGIRAAHDGVDAALIGLDAVRAAIVTGSRRVN